MLCSAGARLTFAYKCLILVCCRSVINQSFTYEMQLTDCFNRKITSLRISVTDRCNFRCIYCMPSEGVEFLERSEILRFEEIKKLSQIAVRLGINKIRLTGGEPLVRNDISKLVKELSALEGLDDLGLTTNGFRLSELAEELYTAGLRRINVSLDSLNPQKYARITRRDALDKVLEGLDVAKKCGFSPIKINVVAMRGFTEGEILSFARLARRESFRVRFIEFMPVDADSNWKKLKIIQGSEIFNRIHAVYPLEPASDFSKSSTAKRYRFKDSSGEIGIIASVSEPFCQNCSRIRITADGKLRTCLFSTSETDLRKPLRSGASDQQIAQTVIKAVKNKEPGHKINDATFTKPDRNMSMIGG